MRDFAPPGTRLLLASSVVATVPMGYLLVVLPLYLDRVGMGPAFIGFLFTVSGLVTSLIVAFSGMVADRWGRRRFLIAGALLPVPSYLVFAFSTDPLWLTAASVLGGVGFANGAAGALTISSFDALLAEKAPPNQRTHVFGGSQALWNAAIAAGTAAAAVPALLRVAGLSEVDSYRIPYFVMAALAVASTALLLPLREDVQVRAARVASGWWPKRSRSAIATYAVAVGFLGFGLGIAVQLLPLWFSLRFGVDEADLAPWYTASQVLSMGTLLVIPTLDRRLGAPKSILWALAISGATLAFIVVSPTFLFAAALMVVRSFFTNLSWPFHQSLLMATTVPEERATAIGAGFAVWGFANALGPLASGALLAAGVFTLPLLVGSVMYFLGGLVFGYGFTRLLARERPSGAAAFSAIGDGKG